MQIEVEVKGQRIKRINSPGSVEDTLNYLTCYFTFDGEEWDNTVKTAYFRNPASGKTYSQMLAEDNTCTVPWEALTDRGFVKFSVSGERENYRITTGIESIYNGETVYGGEPSEPPTPDQYDQMIALAEQTKEIAESVREDADAGEFDGEPGKPGDPGKDGVSPTAKVDETNDGAVITVTDATGTTTAKLKNGKDGNPGQNATDEQVRTAVEAYMEEHPIQGDTEDIIKLAIKNEASGAVPVVITDSADMGVQDLEMQGWTKQDSTEGKNLFEIPDITAEIFDTKIECNITQPITISATNEATVSTKIWRFRAKYQDGTYAYAVDMDSSFVKTFDASEENPISEITYRGSYITSGAYRNVQIEYGESATAYEPYTGGKPSPNPDYPQEITSAGTYNDDTQKWEYEITIANEQTDPDKNQTVLLTSDRPLTKWDRLEKRNGQWGWVYKSMEITLDGSEQWKTIGNGFYIAGGIEDTVKYDKNMLIDKLIYASSGEYPRFIVTTSGEAYTPLIFNVEDSVNGIKEWLASNPLTVWYETTEETFVPLTAEEQEQMNALHTYYSTTMLSNDAGCDMALTYIADTKAYIDNKVSAIQAAIVNTI